jgi:hypothetical protein
MIYVMVTGHRGIIDRATFYDNVGSAVRTLADFVKGMNVLDDDAGVFGPGGLIASAKDFLDENDQFFEGDELFKELISQEEKAARIYLIGNPDHPLGFMVASPDDPLGFEDPAEAVSELGQMRNSAGSHLKLYRVIPVENPIVSRAELERYNEKTGVEDFVFPLVEEYVRS